MVGNKQDQRVFIKPSFFQVLKEALEMQVHKGHFA